MRRMKKNDEEERRRRRHKQEWIEGIWRRKPWELVRDVREVSECGDAKVKRVWCGGPWEEGKKTINKG